MRKLVTENAFIGKNVFYLPSCHSTNSTAIQLSREKTLVHGDIIWTNHQMSGRGQQSNKWEGAPGQNLTFSIVLFPHFLPFNKQFFLNIVTTLAVKELLATFKHPGFIIKWPNDILYYNKKICGILIENQVKNQNSFISVIGVGININQELFTNSRAISLKNICGRNFDLWELMKKWTAIFEKWYRALENGSWDHLKTQYESNLYWLDEWHLFRREEGYFKGNIKGINPQGLLQIDDGLKICEFRFKEVSFVE